MSAVADDNKHVTVQTLLNKMLLDDDGSENETIQLLTFTRDNGVPITNDQAAAMFLLNENGMADIANYMMNVRTTMLPLKSIFKMMNISTMADRIKGTMKLSNLMKANANPAGSLNVDKALGKQQ